MLEAMKLGLTSYHRAEASRSIGNIHLAFLSMVHSRKNAITHPMTAIAITPASKLINATACLPIPLLHKVGSSTKSPASISTHAAYISIPADMAFGMSFRIHQLILLPTFRLGVSGWTICPPYGQTAASLCN